MSQLLVRAAVGTRVSQAISQAIGRNLWWIAERTMHKQNDWRWKIHQSPRLELGLGLKQDLNQLKVFWMWCLHQSLLAPLHYQRCDSCTMSTTAEHWENDPEVWLRLKDGWDQIASPTPLALPTHPLESTLGCTKENVDEASWGWPEGLPAWAWPSHHGL